MSAKATCFQEPVSCVSSNSLEVHSWYVWSVTTAGMLQVLITGKISQAVVVAAAAYRNEAAFRERTGIEKVKLIIDEFHTNTHVSPA